MLKFNCLVGNPPYTHLRNFNNRRYAAYPKQRDMAQVFVRWALDHLTEDGVIGYNTTDTWLNVKLSDGAKETRSLINKRLREIIQNEEIMKYSEGDGGDVITFIVCIGSAIDCNVLYNDEIISYSDNELYSPGFYKCFDKTLYPFKSAAVTKYAPVLSGGRSVNKFGTNTEFWKSFIYLDDKGNDFVLAMKRRIVSHTTKGVVVGSFKLIKTNDFASLLDEKLEGEVKNCEVSKEHGLWLVGYFNTSMHCEYIDLWTNRIRVFAHELSNNMWQYCKVPDFDYYKENHPERFQAYMTWIEQNMHDKDAFLAGIDKQFNRLIED